MTPEQRKFAIDNLRSEVGSMDDRDLLQARIWVSIDYWTFMNTGVWFKDREYLQERGAVLEEEVLARMSGKSMKTRIIEFIKSKKWHPGGARGSVNPETVIKAIEEL